MVCIPLLVQSHICTLTEKNMNNIITLAARNQMDELEQMVCCVTSHPVGISFLPRHMYQMLIMLLNCLLNVGEEKQCSEKQLLIFNSWLKHLINSDSTLLTDSSTDPSVPSLVFQRAFSHVNMLLVTVFVHNVFHHNFTREEIMHMLFVCHVYFTCF